MGTQQHLLEDAHAKPRLTRQQLRGCCVSQWVLDQTMMLEPETCHVCGSTAALCGQQWELARSPRPGKPGAGLQRLGAAAPALNACLFKINTLYK